MREFKKNMHIGHKRIVGHIGFNKRFRMMSFDPMTINMPYVGVGVVRPYFLITEHKVSFGFVPYPSSVLIY